MQAFVESLSALGWILPENFPRGVVSWVVFCDRQQFESFGNSTHEPVFDMRVHVDQTEDDYASFWNGVQCGGFSVITFEFRPGKPIRSYKSDTETYLHPRRHFDIPTKHAKSRVLINK